MFQDLTYQIKKKITHKRRYQQSSVTCLLCILQQKDALQQKILFTQLNSKKNHKVSKQKKTSSFWITKYEHKEEEKEGGEVMKNLSYEKEENIIYEVGFSSEKAPEKRDALKPRRVPPCTPLTSQPIHSPATFLIYLFSQSNLFLLFSCVFLYFFTHKCIYIYS